MPTLVRERSGDGEPLVLLHGLGESAAGWHPVREALAHHYDVISLDLPGFGSSPRLAEGVLPTAAALADVIEGELDHLGLADVHLAGYSLGARVALDVATRGRGRSVVAISPDGLGTPLERAWQALALLNGRWMARALLPASGPLTANPVGRAAFFAGERSRPWRLTADDARDLLLAFAQSPSYEATVHATAIDVTTGLERISCPVVVLQGTVDPLVALQSPRYLAFLPQAELRWLPGLGHAPMSDDPCLVSRLMLDFLSSATSTEAA